MKWKLNFSKLHYFQRQRVGSYHLEKPLVAIRKQKFSLVSHVTPLLSPSSGFLSSSD